ncbi:MAG TPA: VanZ family protein [Candidatus Acidoferrum sp.]|nr:VanZ family protein [Candidatus Acidoferrum sp.]
MRFLFYWGPVLAVGALISVASTGHFGSAHTSRIIIPMLRWIFPHAQQRTLEFIHHLIRKGAHVFEYSVFSALVWRAIRFGRDGWRWSWAGWTVVVVAGFSLLDEFHQSFVPGRGASVLDSLLDTCAGALALLVLWQIVRWRTEPREGRQQKV